MNVRPKSQDHLQQSVIRSAVMRGDVTEIKGLLENGVSPDDMTEAASNRGDYQMLQFLFEHKANINHTGLGWCGTLLNQACCPRRSAMVDFLLQHKADPNTRGAECGLTPLEYITKVYFHADSWALEHVQLLLNAKADIWAQDSQGQTVLEESLKIGYGKIVNEFEKFAKLECQ